MADSYRRNVIVLHFMSGLPAFNRHFVMVIALSVLLLGGRSVLGTHAYEHDLGTPASECEFCEFTHVFSDALESSVASAGTPSSKPTERPVVPHLRTHRRRIHLPRAPPTNFV